METAAQRESDSVQRWSRWILIVTIALIAIVGFDLCCFAFPRADDLCRAAQAREHGFSHALVNDYTGWTGRWVSSALEYAVGAWLPLEATYRYLLIGIALITFAGLYSMLRAALGESLKRSECALLAGLGLALYWAGTPGLANGLYWLPATIENVLSLAVMMLLVAALITTRSTLQPSMRVSRTMLLVALAVLAPGMHELYGAGLCTVLVVGTVLTFRSRHANRMIWLCVTAFALVGMAIVVLAPGNAIRQASVPGTGRSLRSLFAYLLFWSRILTGWLVDSKLLGATLLLFISPQTYRVRPKWLSDEPKLWQFVVPGTGLLVLAGLIAGPWVALGKPDAPDRTRAAIYLVFLLVWFATVFVHLRARREPESTLNVPAAARLLAVVQLAAALLFTGNFIVARRDLVTKAPAQRDQLRSRAALIQRAKDRGQLDLVVPRLEDPPVSLDDNLDVQVAASALTQRAWINECAARYLGLRSIASEPELPAPPAALDPLAPGPPRHAR